MSGPTAGVVVTGFSDVVSWATACVFCCFRSVTVKERGSSVVPEPVTWSLVIPTEGATVEATDVQLVGAAAGLVVLFTLAVELQEVAPEVPELGADVVARSSLLPVTSCGFCWFSAGGFVCWTFV